MIYLTGDIHGQLDIDKVTKKQFPQQKELTRNDYLIQLGDLGLLWQKDKTFYYLMDFWTSRPYTLLWIDGNHENHTWLNSYSEEEWNGGKVHKIASNIIHLMRGYVYEIDGRTFFTMGGARSIDKGIRTAYKDWWPEEEPSGYECMRGWKNLERCGFIVDYVLTHSAPYNVLSQMFKEAVKYEVSGTERYLTSVLKELVSFKRWYFGHYHKDTCWYKFYCLYNKITTLEQIWVKGVDY